jgi:probable selenium-dependent hydroxylase accessory protein YqeC
MAGCYNGTKVEAPKNIDDINTAAKRFNLVLMEADGSKTLPLKGWADFEPVVPDWTTVYIGVIPLWPVGKSVSAALIHRLPLFEKLTGSKEGKTITLEHIANAITGTNGKGLFSAAKGKKYLYLSQIEDETAFEQAEQLMRLLPHEFCKTLKGAAAGGANGVRPLLPRQPLI